MQLVLAPPQDRTALAPSQGQVQDRDDGDDVIADPVFEKNKKGRQIGQGAFGKVHNAGFRRSTGIVVAMKFANIDENCPDVAERELTILNRVRHDSIVPLALLDHFGPTPCRDTAVFV